MKAKKNNDRLTEERPIPVLLTGTEAVLSPELANRFALYPENKRRPINKTLFRNEYFQLTYSLKDQSMSVSSRGDIVYSAIPYDTARNYIQRAAIQYLLHPEEARHYIESHQANLENYLMLSIYQTTQKRVTRDSPEVQSAYQAIFQAPLFEIQILGRLLQHDETGPLSANLAGKFLYSENRKTGIAEYLSEYLRFVVQLTQSLPVVTDGKAVQLLDHSLTSHHALHHTPQEFLAVDSKIDSGLNLLPVGLKRELEQTLLPSESVLHRARKPLLRSEFGKELADVRRNYQAHSVHPKELEPYFENVHATENTNRINVVSDCHTVNGQLPFTNAQFNILAGDMSASQVSDVSIRGIYVIGNQELVDVLPLHSDYEAESWQAWQPFLQEKWFQKLLANPDDAWHLLPTGDHPYYVQVATELESRFPKMKVLNNQSLIHEGIRYIGLTIPVALVKRKKAQQAGILTSLKKLLGEDHDIPTVIVSHAPLFNELSMLSAKSPAYKKSYRCAEPAITKLFETYNIIGVVHGHHHIPASAGRYQMVAFAGKELFVVCSIYSKMNTGFELATLIDDSLPSS